MFKKIKFWLWKKGLCSIAGRAPYKDIRHHIKLMKLVANNKHYHFMPYSLVKTSMGYLDSKPELQDLLEDTWRDMSMSPGRKKAIYIHVLTNAIKAAEELCNE